MNILKNKWKVYIVLTIAVFLAFGISSCESSNQITGTTPSSGFQIDQQSCKACGNCYEACPHNAIVFDGDKPTIVQSKCQKCGECVSVCPENAIY